MKPWTAAAAAFLLPGPQIFTPGPAGTLAQNSPALLSSNNLLSFSVSNAQNSPSHLPFHFWICTQHGFSIHAFTSILQYLRSVAFGWFISMPNLDFLISQKEQQSLPNKDSIPIFPSVFFLLEICLPLSSQRVGSHHTILLSHVHSVFRVASSLFRFSKSGSFHISFYPEESVSSPDRTLIFLNLNFSIISSKVWHDNMKGRQLERSQNTNIVDGCVEIFFTGCKTFAWNHAVSGSFVDLFFTK